MKLPLLLLASVALAAAPARAQTALQTLESPTPQSTGYFGTAVAAVPDVDGDGVDDVLVGAQSEDPYGNGDGKYGRAHVFSGATGALLYSIDSPNPNYNGYFGYEVAGVPDTDGDGRGDLLVSASLETRVYLFSGADGTLLHELASPNPQAGVNFGGSIAGVPDVDGDGRGDLLVGASKEDMGFEEAGRAYLFSGASGAHLYEFSSIAPEEFGRFGQDVAGVPDLNGDGTADLLVAEHRDVELSGYYSIAVESFRISAFSGATGALIGSIDEPSIGMGEPFPGYISVAGLEDVNGDGRGDILAGAPNQAGTGRAYVFSGADGTRLVAPLASPNAELGGEFGESVAGVPDLDGDGRPDLLIGARKEDPGSSPFSVGRAYVFSGVTGALLDELASPNAEPGGQFGEALAGIEDLDGDGRGDLVVGAGHEGFAGLTFPGRVYVFASAASPVTIALGPAAPNPTVPAGGGTFTFTATLRNLSAETQTFEAWTQATLPDGSATAPLVGPVTVTLGPGETVSKTLTQRVPAGAPAGTYVYTGFVGNFPDAVESSSGFAVTKAAGRAAAGAGTPAAWEASYAGSGAPVTAGDTWAAGARVEGPAAFALAAPWPNPFATQTQLRYEIPVEAHVRLTAYDVLGRQVAVLVDGTVEAGQHEATFDAAGLPSGTYLVRLETGTAVQTQRVTLLR